MKNTLFLLTSTFLMTFGGLAQAATPWSDVDIDVQDLGPQDIQNEDSGQGPFSIELSGDYIGKAKVRCPGFNNVQFATAQANASAIYYYDPCCKEGLTVGVAYTFTRLDWKYNPYFTQKDYSMASINLGGFSMRMPDWIWRAQVSANFDNLEHWNFSDFMSYDLLLWGRYEYCKDIGVHVGFIALTGMKIDRVYPIVGFDWTFNRDWKLNLVFPVDLSLIYTINPCWNVALAGRFFNQRHRTGKDEFIPEALWFYTTGGTELAVNWLPTKLIKANIHAGYNYGGHLKIANRHYRHGHRLRLDGAPYAGAEIDMNF